MIHTFTISLTHDTARGRQAHRRLHLWKTTLVLKFPKTKDEAKSWTLLGTLAFQIMWTGWKVQRYWSSIKQLKNYLQEKILEGLSLPILLSSKQNHWLKHSPITPEELKLLEFFSHSNSSESWNSNFNLTDEEAFMLLMETIVRKEMSFWDIFPRASIRTIRN